MKKILYINPIPEEILIISFIDNFAKKEFLQFSPLELSENLPKIIIQKFLQEKYDEIWIINWPWTFTKMRIISLVINSIKYTFPNIIIKSAHFFEIFKNNTIPLIEINSREFLTKNSQGEEIIIPQNSLTEGDYEWYISTTSTYFDNNCRSSTFKKFEENPDVLIEIFSEKKENNFISPLYIKPPNITIWKQ